MGNKRGIVLGVVLLAAVAFSISAFAALTMALTRTRLDRLYAKRFRAQYAAEAGLVWAMQRLWVNQGAWSSAPGWAGPPNDPPEMDTNGNGTPDTKVDIILPPCGAPCEARKLQAKVDY
jgi:Tfp pilus assembly protein PilX